MDPIEVTNVELYPENNAQLSHTLEYGLVHNKDMPTAVLRRGSEFYFAIRFSREVNFEFDVIRVQFGFGPRPHVLKGTRAILPVLPDKTQLVPHLDKWDLALNRNDGDSLMFHVHIPSNAPVGIWSCNVQSNIRGGSERKDYKLEEDIYILFNPWCESDGVYLPNEDERFEYVLNENGKIFCGTFKNPKGKRWVYGQFTEAVLPAAVFLLERAGLLPADRGSPMLVSRAISAVINSVDDNGLLEGRWDGNYGDGVSPHAWTGSSAIMDQYLSSGGQPVKYGQCWVFSAATVTVCRALGIPCRSTTNYISAHDTNCSLTVDKYFDIFGNKIENGPEGDCNDSCWNFHVWNDVWMTRPDLPPGYGGWQVIDATPQEASGGIFRCGPASVEAVRRGEVGYLYDTPFVFSEVNADVCHFQEDEDSVWGFSRTSINQYHVGRKIVTKAVGIDDQTGDADMRDVTRLFKNPEGTEAERLAVYNAVKGVPKAQQFYELPAKEQEDVFFDLIDIDEVPLGDQFEVVVQIRNESSDTRTITAVLSASSVYYTGTTGNVIKRSQANFRVPPGETEVLRMEVSKEDYLDKLVDHGLIKIYSIANVKETRQTWSEEDDFSLTKPVLNIDVQDEFRVETETPVYMSFKNPFSDLPLTDCTITIEGAGLCKPKIVNVDDVEPDGVMQISEVICPKRAGERTMVANFGCREIQGISGCTKINVNE